MVWSDAARRIVSRLIERSLDLADSTSHADAVRLGALHIGWSLWANYFLRPNGEVVVIGEDYDDLESETIYTDRSHILRMLVAGSERYPELKELLPQRPADAVDCPCQRHEVFATRKVLCPDCGGLGWLPAKEGKGSATPN